MTTTERETLVYRVKEFDPSDDYHKNDFGDVENTDMGYYAAIDRVVRLLRGEITDWKSPREGHTRNSLPVGTLIVIGHPANNKRAVKLESGWFYCHSNSPVDPEDWRAGWGILA